MSFLKFFHQNAVCTFAVADTYHLPCPSHSCPFYHPGNTWRWVKTMKLFAVLSHSFSSYFALRGPDIFLILSLCSSLSVTDQFSRHKKHIRNYSSVYFDLYLLREQTKRHKILYRMIANMSWIPPALNFFMICFGLSHKIEIFFLVKKLITHLVAILSAYTSRHELSFLSSYF